MLTANLKEHNKNKSDFGSNPQVFASDALEKSDQLPLLRHLRSNEVTFTENPAPYHFHVLMNEKDPYYRCNCDKQRLV